MRTAPLAPDWTLDQGQAEQLSFAALTAFTSIVAPREAVQAEVRSLGVRVTELYDERDLHASAAEFDKALHAMSKVRAEEARALVATWPAVQRFVREFDAATDRKQALRDWTVKPPSWMQETPASGLLWMADLAEENGMSKEAAVLIGTALDEGASPAAFWQLRQDLLKVPEDAAMQRDALRAHIDSHVIARAITTFLDGDPGAALTLLEDFNPGPQERRHAEFVRCQILSASGRIEDAFQLAHVELVDGAPGSAQFVADRLLALGSERTSASHFSLLRRGLELALKVRDEVREWGSRGSSATLTAIQACELLGDVERGLRLASRAPEGEATESEAKDPKIEAKRVTLAARVLSVEQGRLVVEDSRASCARSEAEAILAERSGDRAKAKVHWQQASEQAADPEDIFRIAFHLASHGIVATNISKVENARPELIEEIKLLAQLSTGEPGAMEALRGSASNSRQLVFGLLEHLQSVGDLTVAGKIAADAGERWADPDLWFAATELFHTANEHERAVEAARSAQRSSRADWPRHPRLRQYLLSSLSQLGRWSEAAEEAADLVAEAPSDVGGRWALVTCQVHLGREDEAWRAFAEIGERLTPRDAHEMTVRIHLWRTVEKSHESLPEILDLAERWSDDRSVKLALVGALLFFNGDVPEPLSDRVGDRVRAIMAEYPDVFIPQQFDEDDPLASVQRLVDQLPDMSGLDQRAAGGEAPFGLAPALYHRRLLHTLVSRSTPLFANDADRFEDEVSAARASRRLDGSIDSTAVVSLAYLDEALATRAIGYLGRVVAPLRQRVDANASLDELSSLSTMTVGRAPNGGPSIHRITDEEAADRRDRAARCVALYRALHVVERTGESSIPDLGELLNDFVWAESLDLAVAAPGTALWCDDFRIRQFGSALGVKSFSTSALLEAMRRDGVLAEELAAHAQAVLVTRGLVGGRFDAALAVDAAGLDGWRASGVAAFVAYGPREDDAKPLIDFVATAMKNNLEAPDVVRGWAHSMTLWLVRIGGEENAEANLVMFLRALLQQAWLTGAVFPFIMDGVRDVTDERGLADPLEGALRAHFKTLTLLLEHPMASAVVRGLVQYGTADDRSAATRAILVGG